jgi:hypothetical protein
MVIMVMEEQQQKIVSYGRLSLAVFVTQTEDLIKEKSGSLDKCANFWFTLLCQT